MTDKLDTLSNSSQTVRNVYTDCKGTGILSTLIFAVVVFLLMMVIAHFKGS